jgi:nicotinate-nucleotide adenylyltransferase
VSTGAARQDGPAGGGAPLGFLGGSFDPVHAGHLALARAAQQALGLEAVVFVPAGRPWQKSGLAPAPQRLALLRLALDGVPQWRIDERELARPGPTYTVDTAQELRALYGAQRPLVWILGADQFAGLPGWHRWTELPGLLHLAVAGRPGSPAPADPALREFEQRHAGTPAELRSAPAGRLLRIPMAPVDCSATQLRAALAGGDLAYAANWLAPGVLEHIRRHHLYERNHGHPQTATPGD